MSHCLTQYGVPGTRWQPTIQRLPGLAGIASAEHGGLTSNTGPRPHRAAIHGHNPACLVVLRMTGHGKTDVADLLWHVVADSFPALFFETVAPIKPVNAAVILMIPTSRVGGMYDGVMGIMTELVLRSVLFRRRKVHRHAAVHGSPGTSPVF